MTSAWPRRFPTFTLAAALGLVALPGGLNPRLAAADPAAKPDPAELKAVLDKAYDALKAKQNDDGSFAPKLGGPGITALTTAALIRSGRGPDDPVVAKALKYLETRVKPDGGVYDKGLANYTTCLAIVAFKEANASGRYDRVIENATKFLKSLQALDGVDPKDPAFGGVGYDGKGRPDLSNSHFFVEALIAAGASRDDPAVKAAVAFVGRCQNLPGEFNDQEFARKATEDDKGGLVYNPFDAEKNQRDGTPQGGLRSAGAKTYAGLKSFLYAGVSKDDPRVKAAVGWIKRHYTLEQNPGMGTAGLFYYYHTFAKALSAWGEDRFTDGKGTAHDWRRELFEALKKRQRPDGSWVNAGDRAYGESTPELATAFALLALSYCQPVAGK